jgi:HAD superfamily hydrolase (TIGR01509 family)
MAKQYILFDHDGVLVDSERWYYEATRETFMPLGIKLDKLTYLDFMTQGRSCWELVRNKGISESQIAFKRTERDQLYQTFLQTRDIEIEGVEEVLAHLYGKKRMAIVTTSRQEDFKLIQNSRNLLQYFEFCITPEDYFLSKPEPDPYLCALKKFGARTEEAVAVEDSQKGLLSAVAAGLDCIIIKNSFTTSQDFSKAWRVIDSIRDLPELVGC